MAVPIFGTKLKKSPCNLMICMENMSQFSPDLAVPATRYEFICG
jgi:hypothetical protein